MNRLSPNRPIVNRHRLAGITATLVMMAVLLLPTSAEAAGDVVAVGWWTRLPTASAPDGGVNVGSAPDGPNSVAAIRIDLGNGLTSLTVSAAEAGGSPSTASVQACPADDGWAAAAGGGLADAPAIDCTNGVPFVRGDDGTWTADVSALVSGQIGTASIGFVAAGPSGDNPLGLAPSEVQYDAPTASGTAVATTTAPTTAPAATSPPTTRPATVTPRPTPTTRPTPRPTTPPTTDPTTDTTVFAFPQATTTTTIPIAEERALPAITSAGVSSSEDRPIQEAFFLVFLACLIGVGVGGASKIAEARAG